MAKDPNKIYLPNGTEAKKVDKNAASKASRDRFAANREKYKNTAMPPQTPKEKANAAKPGRVSGATVAAAQKAKRMAQTAAVGTNKKNPAKPVVKATSKTTVKPKGTPAKKPTVPPDYDVILPGYNDRASVNKANKEAAARAAKKKKGM